MVHHFPLESFLSQHQRKKQKKKHVKRCKVAPMQKDVYWPQHTGDFCRGAQEVARARKGSCCPMNSVQCYLSWTQSVRHPSYKKKMMEKFVVILTSRTFSFHWLPIHHFALYCHFQIQCPLSRQISWKVVQLLTIQICHTRNHQFFSKCWWLGSFFPK